jgi:hypothetical protein
MAFVTARSVAFGDISPAFAGESDGCDRAMMQKAVLTDSSRSSSDAMHLFATADLRKRLHVDDRGCAHVDTPDPIGSWYGHIQQIGRTKLIVLVHAHTRFTVVLDAKGLVSVDKLHKHWMDEFPRVAEEDAMTRRSVAPLIIDEATRVSKAVDRRLIGTMTDWFRLIRGHADMGHALEPRLLAHWLNETPLIAGRLGSPRGRLAAFIESLGTEDQALAARSHDMQGTTSSPERVGAESQTERHVLPTHLGRWRIVEMPYFADGMMDCCGPAEISFDAQDFGDMQFCALAAGLEVRAHRGADHIDLDWTWQGDDDGTEVCGRGQATVRGDRMEGIIFIHHGDEMSFVAKRKK